MDLRDTNELAWFMELSIIGQTAVGNASWSFWFLARRGISAVSDIFGRASTAVLRDAVLLDCW